VGECSDCHLDILDSAPLDRGQHHFPASSKMAAAAAPPPPPSAPPAAIITVGTTSIGLEVRMPPRYVLRRRHVVDALEGVPDVFGDVTVWIHSSTLGIEKRCFVGMERVSRILVSGHESHAPGGPLHAGASAPALGAFVAKLGTYEPALVGLIREFAGYMGNDEMHRVGDSAFSFCFTLREVVLPRSITHIGKSAFFKCTSLTSMTLPDSLAHVGAQAFLGTSLTSVTLPNSLTTLRSGAFQECISLTSVTIPNSLTHIHIGTFRRCYSLAQVTLPDSLTHIGEEAFSGCTALAHVTMPVVRPYVGEDAFRDCPWRLPPTTAP
jgi:hypothetical protein